MAYKIYMYDTDTDCIGSGALCSAYIQYQLELAAGQDVEVHISSVGGSAFDAIAIYDLLKKYNGTVNTFIDALAASAASIVAMGGKTVTMSKYALLMIHKPSIGSGGNADELMKDVQMLNVVQDRLAAIYMDKTGLDEDTIGSLINAVTWMSADQALDLGFIDAIEDYQAETQKEIKNSTLIRKYTEGAPAIYQRCINKILTIENKTLDKPKFKKGDEVEILVNHMEGMKGMKGSISSVEDGPYYSVTLDNPMSGMSNPHKWMAENEITKLSENKTKNTMNTENKELIEKTSSVLDKIMNFFKKVVNKKTVTNKGEIYHMGVLNVGSEVFKDEDMENKVEDGEYKDADAKNTITVKDSIVTNVEDDCDEDDNDDDEDKKKDDDEDDDTDPENKAVLNELGVTVTNKTDRKDVVNKLAGKLKELNDKVNAQNELLVEAKTALDKANERLEQTKEQVKNEIKSSFTPPSSQRSTKAVGKKEDLPAFAQPTKGSLAERVKNQSVAKLK